MKTKTSKFQLITMLVLLLIAIVSVTNVTYSFFSSTSSTGGEKAFGNMNMRWFYTKSGGGTTYITNNVKLSVVPDGPISRGKSFSVHIKESDGSLLPVQTIGFNNNGSVSCYVRFWIDAFVDGDETKTNYGKYFYIERSSNDYVRKTVASNSEPACYYAVYEFGAYEESYFYQNKEGSTKYLLKMQDIPTSDLNPSYKTELEALPLSILGESLKITISFEAVQTANNAWETEFNDEKGYYLGWM